MELTTESRKIIRSSEGEAVENKFTIKASAQAFSILSDRLYSDKITAIIRELSCNAYDAHIAAGVPELPFELRLPTWQSPQFSIRDYGIGLSKESVENIYTTYFESTKAESNDFVGCLGLGSKTPFSYTDSFLVESFFKGKKYTYTAFINEDGVPSLRSLGEEDTTENNGLKVSFAVKREDFSNFDYKAKEVFRWFKTRPIVKGNEYWAFKDAPVYSKIGDDWDLYSNSEQPISYVRMGNVVYPISIDKFPQDFPYELKNLLSNSIIFHCDIGDVDIAPSREALVYNKKTVACLKARIERFAEEIAEDLNFEIKDLDCWYDAVLYAQEKGWFYNNLINGLINSGEVLFNKRKLYNGINQIDQIIGKYFNNGLKIWDGHYFSKYIYGHSHVKDFVLIENLEKIPEKRLKEIMLHNKVHSAFLINSKVVPFAVSNNLIDKFGIDDKYIKSILDYPQPPVKPKPVKVAGAPSLRSSTGKKSSAVWTLQYSNDDKARFCWSPLTSIIDLADTTGKRYFLPIKNFDMVTPDHSTILNKCDDVKTYSFLYGHMKKADPTLTVYGLTERQYEKIQTNKTWTHFDDLAVQFLSDYFTENSLVRYYEAKIATSFSKELRDIISGSKNKELKAFVDEITLNSTNGKYSTTMNAWTLFPRKIHKMMDQNHAAAQKINEVTYSFPYDEELHKELKTLDPNSYILKFIDACKKHKILLNYCSSLRLYANKSFSIADATRILDLDC